MHEYAGCKRRYIVEKGPVLVGPFNFKEKKMAPRRNREKTLMIRFFVYIVLLYYLYVLFKTSIFNRFFSNNLMRGLVYVPFSSGMFSLESISTSVGIRKLLGPVLIFVPMGLILPLAHDKTKKFWVVLLISATFSLGIEILQYITKTGITSIDDFILNILGAAFGFLAYKLLREVFIYG